MPRYFFDLENHDSSRDDEGVECKDADEARIQGVVFTGEYLRDNPDTIWDGQEMRTVVREEGGRIVLTIVSLSVNG